MINVVRTINSCIRMQLGVCKFHRWLAPTLKSLRIKRNRLPPRLPDPRNTWIEWNYDAELYAFGKRLGEEFDNDLLRTALIDASFIVKNKKEQVEVGLEPDALNDNKILADRGERFLENYIDRYLSCTLPKLPKKYNRQIQEFLLSQETLSHIGKNIGLDDIILGEAYPLENSTLASGFKAIIGALLESSGEERASVFVRDIVMTQLCGKDLTPFVTPASPIEELASLMNSTGQGPVEPRLLAQAAVNTLLPVYQIGLYNADKRLIGKGFGESAEIAEEMAACDALWKIWGIKTNMSPFPISNFQLPPLKQSIL